MISEKSSRREFIGKTLLAALGAGSLALLFGTGSAGIGTETDPFVTASYVLTVSNGTITATSHVGTLPFSGTDLLPIWNSIKTQLPNGGVVFLKTGTYPSSGKLLLDIAGIGIVGEQVATTIIQQNVGVSDDMIQITNDFCIVNNLALLGNAGSGTSGVGLRYTSGAFGKMEKLFIQNTNEAGLLVEANSIGTGFTVFRDIWVNSAGASVSGSFSIIVKGQNYFFNNIISQTPSFGNFGFSIDGASGCVFDGLLCPTGDEESNIVIQATTIKTNLYTACNVLGIDGFSTATAWNILGNNQLFVDCFASFTIRIAGSRNVIHDTTIDVASLTVTNGYLIVVGALNNIINGGAVVGTVTNKVNAALNTKTRVRDLINFNPQGVAAIAVGASPFTYTNQDSVSEAVYVNGGTITNLTKDGIVIFGAGVPDSTIWLEPGEAIVVTYTVAPVMNKDRK